MRYYTILLAALAFAICFSAVEARSKGTVLFCQSASQIEERAQDHEQGLLRYWDRRREGRKNRNGPVCSWGPLWTVALVRQSLELLRTSVLCALERRVSERAESLCITRDRSSIVLFPTSWFRAVTLPLEMVLEASLSTERSLLMRTSSWSTRVPESFRWLTLVLILTDLSSSSRLYECSLFWWCAGEDSVAGWSPRCFR